jgi:hypothetical protein
VGHLPVCGEVSAMRVGAPLCQYGSQESQGAQAEMGGGGGGEPQLRPRAQQGSAV